MCIHFGTSSIDRKGCVDTDGDGYSDSTFNWTIAQGADMFINDATQWFDQDGDGYGDNAGGNNPDACPSVVGTSTGDRYGCVDSDMDSYSDAETNLGGWTIAQGADACRTVPGTSNGDRNGCPDEDGDGYSDPDPSGTNGSVWLVANGADAFPETVHSGTTPIAMDTVTIHLLQHRVTIVSTMPVLQLSTVSDVLTPTVTDTRMRTPPL